MTTTMRPITELIRDPIPQTATEAFWLTGWQVAQATTDTQVRGILRGWEYADVIPPHQIRRLLLTLPTEVADLVFPYWESVATTYADIR